MKYILSLLLVVIVLNATNASCEEAVVLNHTPLNGDALPNPGQKVLLSFLLPKVKDLSLKVRALVVIDGQAMDLTMNGSLDELDRTGFKTEIRAPLHDLSYQFFISGLEKKGFRSKVYNVKRSCVPETTLVNPTLPSDISTVESARQMVETTKLLERDIEAYSSSVEIIKSLMEKMK